MSLAGRLLVGPMPRNLVARIADRYIAGNSPQLAFKEMLKFHSNGFFSTYDILVESARTSEEADRNFHDYINAFEMSHVFPSADSPGLQNEPLTISVKPSAIVCRKDNPEEAQTRLTWKAIQLMDHSLTDHIPLTLDMEDYTWTDLTLDTAKTLWGANKRPGIVLQTRLHRTMQDIVTLFGNESDFADIREELSVRLCIGVYNEPRKIALKSRKMMKQRLVDYVALLQDYGVYTKVATQDINVVKHVLEKKYDPQRVEFQFLNGVPIAEQVLAPMVTGAGYTARFYMPGKVRVEDGDVYTKRRLMENPRMILPFLEGMFVKKHVREYQRTLHQTK